MAMGRSVQPPEDAGSPGEFNARLELAEAELDRTQTPLWRGAAWLLFMIVLVLGAYAVQGGHWWLWPCLLAPLGALGAMAVRAAERAERQGARAAEPGQMHEAWLDYLQRRSPTL
jgi:hypothetical protein